MGPLTPIGTSAAFAHKAEMISFPHTHTHVYVQTHTHTHTHTHTYTHTDQKDAQGGTDCLHGHYQAVTRAAV